MFSNKPKYDMTTITVTSYDRKVSIELPLDSDAHEVFDAFKTIMVGMTFHEKAFDDAVVGYFYEHGLDKDDTVPATEMKFFTDGAETFRVTHL